MKKAIRIAILGSRGIPAKYGGFETFAEELSIRLARLGFEVDVFCEADESKPAERYKGVGLIHVKRYRLGPLTTLLFDAICLWQARKGFDFVYMLGYGAGLFAFIPRIWGTRVWINMDGIEWARSKWGFLARQWFKMMEWAAFRVANRVIADAEAIQSHLLSRHGRRPECDVIAYGAYPVQEEPDRAILGEWELESRGYFLVVCRLEPENHVLEIIQGFASSRTDRCLIIVGDHRHPGQYVEKLLSVKDERIRFIGTVFDKRKLTCLRFHCLAYFHGHSVGGTNPSLLEAMGCGNLVIAHDNSFNREVLGGSGLFFKNGQSIPAVIRQVESQGFESEPFRIGSRKTVEERYSWDLISHQYSEAFHRDMPATREPQAVSRKVPNRIPIPTDPG
jgi:glycosyltransferase involved in cell wall biosynthesis